MSKELLDHALELLAPLGSLRSRRMFGGYGIYVDELFIAIIAFEQLWLKADELSLPRFETAGCRRFEYSREGQTTGLRYYSPPEDALESPALMLPWARLALEAALRAQALKSAKTARKSNSKPAPRRGRSE
ncbi:TfoX/Sxy family protein [Paucibacter sp. APW11]|uniref:TfoX/Sxy family protein n=1 Tax=Roseateles aquae TaxID=3077235 RepID=A0ABU3PAW4_9BURK|nr:TfoX/Sxy family protein [Paucibacter sp. APW11]MDT8999662.1 TfoX/Sxy family protein [Paucibacter sp. APW11]